MSAILLRAALSGAAVLFAQAAGAQTADVTTYPASHFAAFSPQTALDIVQRTPGFTLVEGEDVRGFGAAGSNVLIDGARPSSKSGGIADALGRIPASRVERVELLRNANTSEAQGQTLVLNVVRRAGAASGTWFVEAERNGVGTVYPRGEATWSGTVGDWETSLKANAFWEQFPFETVRVNRDAQGALTSTYETFLPSTLSETFVSGDATRAVGGGRLNVTGRFGRSDYSYDQPSDIFLGRFPDGAPDQRQVSRYDGLTWSGEVGIDYTRLVRDWTWKTVGLASGSKKEVAQTERTDTRQGRLTSAVDVASSSRPLELVARSTFAAPTSWKLKPEIGAEIAYNRLNSTFALSVNDGTGSGPRPIPVPAANVLVEETRAEAFANLAWTASETVTLEGGLAIEGSEITVSGDADQNQGFVFFKPSIAVAWRATPRLQFRVGARRTVGQLNFSDFAASTDLSDDQSQAGNPDLGPDQTTRVYASADYRGQGDLTLALELFHERRQDVLEQVILPSGAPGLANAGDATFSGVKGSATLPLDRWWAGARLTAAANVVRSRFDDPLIGRTRELSGIWNPEITLAFRRDVPGGRWSWGVDYEVAGDTVDFYPDEINSYEENEQWNGFIETRAFGGVKTRLAIRQANPERGVRRRTFFAPDRSGAIIGSEERRRAQDAFVTLTVSGSF